MSLYTQIENSVLQSVAVGCNVLQCVAVCCGVLMTLKHVSLHKNGEKGFTECCSVLQCIAVCYIVCYSVMQCVVVWWCVFAV